MKEWVTTCVRYVVVDIDIDIDVNVDIDVDIDLDICAIIFVLIHDSSVKSIQSGNIHSSTSIQWNLQANNHLRNVHLLYASAMQQI